MKTKIIKKEGWEVEYGGKTLLVPANSILNGTLAEQAYLEQVGIQVGYSNKTTPMTSYKSADKEKKKIDGAPENKSSK